MTQATTTSPLPAEIAYNLGLIEKHAHDAIALAQEAVGVNGPDSIEVATTLGQIQARQDLILMRLRELRLDIQNAIAKAEGGAL